MTDMDRAREAAAHVAEQLNKHLCDREIARAEALLFVNRHVVHQALLAFAAERPGVGEVKAIQVLREILRCDEDGSGLYDCHDNDGVAYQSAHMEGVLKKAREVVAAAPPIPATCGGEGKIAELEGDLRKARRNATDRLYMLDAVVQMLGPKGREVWNMWQAKGVVRQHTSWGPDAALLTGEEVAQVHLDCEAAPKRLVTDVDAHLAALSPTPVAGGGHD